MTYVNRKQTGANGVLLTTTNGSYQIDCPEDIAAVLPRKDADGRAYFRAWHARFLAWCIANTAALTEQRDSGAITPDEYTQRLAAFDALSGRHFIAFFHVIDGWEAAQESVSESLGTPQTHEPQQLALL